jgi:hypothetical protein
MSGIPKVGCVLGSRLRFSRASMTSTKAKEVRSARRKCRTKLRKRGKKHCQYGHWYSNDCSTAAGATFNVPLTFTIYADNGGTPGAVLARLTQTVNVLYRPSADATHCTGTAAGPGGWYKLQDHTCYNGFAQTIKMTFSGVGVTLPSQVIWSVAYNTTHAGYSPIGEAAPCFTSPAGCGYDSLNVGAWSAPNAPYAGTDIDEDKAFRNGVMEPGWTGYRPLGAIAATR